MARDLIPCEVHTPTPEQLRFAASVALGEDSRYCAKYLAGPKWVDVLALDSSTLPKNLFSTRERYELHQVHAVTSARLCFVEPAAWQEACLAALADIQAQAECDHGEESPAGRYEVATPQGSVRTESEAVAQTLSAALRHVGTRAQVRDHAERDPRDGIDRIEGPRVLVEVDGCRVPMSAGDAGQV